MANRHFGGWSDAGSPEESVLHLGFPLEDWDESAAVHIRQTTAGRVIGEAYCNPGRRENAGQQALAVLSLDVDGSRYADVGARDPIIAAQQRLRPGLRPVLFHSPYEAVCAFIIGHRISMAQGRAVGRRMADQLGDAIATPSGVQHAFPRPQVLLELDSFPGVAAVKIARLRAAAQAALDDELRRAQLRSLPEADALAQLHVWYRREAGGPGRMSRS
jgi:DNA-3-methyladenine glycosylase II